MLLCLLVVSTLQAQDFSISALNGSFESNNCGTSSLTMGINHHLGRSFDWEARSKSDSGEWTEWVAFATSTPTSALFYHVHYYVTNTNVGVTYQFRIKLIGSAPAQYSNVLEKFVHGRNAGTVTYTVQRACRTGLDTVTLISTNYLGEISWEYKVSAWNGSQFVMSNWGPVPNSSNKPIMKYGITAFGPANELHTTTYYFRAKTTNGNCVDRSAETSPVSTIIQLYMDIHPNTITANRPMTTYPDGNSSITICDGESVILSASPSNSFFEWTTGETTPSITVTQAGIYYFHSTWIQQGCERFESDKRVTVSVNSNPKPVITIGGIGSACTNTSTTSLNTTVRTGDIYFDWSNGQQGETLNTITANSPGIYTVTAVRNNGCQRTSDPVTLKRNPIIQTANKVICSGESTGLSLISDIGGGTFSWTVQSKSASISGVTVGATGITSTISHVLTNSSVSTAGSVVYRVTPTANGCTGAYQDITVTVNANVTGGQVAANQTICPGGDPVAFTQTSAATGPGTLSYQWQSSLDNVNFNSIGGATAITYNVPAGLTQSTFYRRQTSAIQNGITCSDYSNPLTVTVNSLTGGIIAANQTICSGGNPVAFTQTSPAVGLGTLSYQWQKSTNGTSYSNITGAIATTYDAPSGLTQTTHYKRNVVSSLCGLSTSSNPVTVSVDSVSASITPASKEFCIGQSVSVTLSATSGTGYTYQWKKAGVNIASATSSTYQATQTGSYTVTVTSPNGCQKTSNAAVVSQSTGTGNIRQFGDLCADGYVDLVAAWASAGSNFMWSTNETTQTIRVYNAGNYSVNYTSTSACNMSASTLVELIANPGPCIYARQASIKPEENEIENKSSGITLYPNPADATLTIHLPEPVQENLTISLYSQFGQEVKSAVLVKGEHKIDFDTKSLSKGMYVLTLRTTSGNINMNRKVIINH